MQKIIGLRGNKNVGKDTVAKIFKALLVNNVSFVSADINTSRFASPLKEMLALVLGVEVNLFENDGFKNSVIQGKTVRKHMQDLGSYLRGKNPDIFINLINIPHGIVFIPDVRFKNESDFIKDEGGIIIDIHRGENHDDHESEKIPYGYQTDYTIDNNGTMEELYLQVETIFLQIFN